MNFRIISESCANIYKYKGIPYTCIYANIDTCTSRYEDHRGLDISLMMEELDNYCGEVNVSTPNVKDWFSSIKDEDVTFLLPNASILSDSYHNAMLAKNKYVSMHPDKQVYVINTNTTGPAMKLIIEKLAQLIHEELEITEIIDQINTYVQNVHVCLLFDKPASFVKSKLFSTKERVGQILGMYTCSTLKTQKVCANKKQALLKLAKTLRKKGFQGTKLIISHTNAKEDAMLLSTMLKELFGSISIDIIPNSGINAYTYGKKALLVGFES